LFVIPETFEAFEGVRL